MKRARGVLVFVLVIVLLLSIPGATVFAQETVNDLGPVSSKDVIYQIITDRFYDGDSTNNIPVGFSSNLYDGTGADLKLYQGGGLGWHCSENSLSERDGRNRCLDFRAL